MLPNILPDLLEKDKNDEWHTPYQKQFKVSYYFNWIACFSHLNLKPSNLLRYVTGKAGKVFFVFKLSNLCICAKSKHNVTWYWWGVWFYEPERRILGNTCSSPNNELCTSYKLQMEIEIFFTIHITRFQRYVNFFQMSCLYNCISWNATHITSSITYMKIFFTFCQQLEKPENLNYILITWLFCSNSIFYVVLTASLQLESKKACKNVCAE